VVLVLTENVVGSSHVLREIERASAKRHPVVTFRVEAATLPAGLEYFLSASHWLDATASGVNAALPKLCEAVQRLLAPPAAVESRHHADTAKPAAELFPQRPMGTPSSQRLNRAIVATVVVIAVVVAYLFVDKLWFSKHAASTTLRSSNTSGHSVCTGNLGQGSRRNAVRRHERKEGSGVFLRRVVGGAH
jgi:hypothetical protein